MLLPLLTCDAANNSIQNAAVQYTYDSVLEELWKDSEKKFVSVEMEFFSHWWKEQTSHVKRKVHKVVERYIYGGNDFCVIYCPTFLNFIILSAL